MSRGQGEGDGMTETSQVSLSDFDKRASDFARMRALLSRIIHAQPGLTCEEISKQFLLQYGFLPRIDNRLREMVKLGWVEAHKSEEDGLLHYYPKEEST